MADNSTERLYRAPTEAAPATITLTDGSTLQGHLHLHADAAADGGFESVQHLLDDVDAFFAVTLDSGGVVLVGKAQVVDVRCSLAVGEPLPGTTVHGLEAVLSTGVTLTGLATWSAPPAHGRVIDVLNTSRFLRLTTDDGFVYVNSAHICAAYPRD